MKEQNLQSVYQHSMAVGVPIGIGIKVDTRQGQGSDFIIMLPVV